MFIISYY
jgi:hypothetical protein